jgi:hypothetical protein
MKEKELKLNQVDGGSEDEAPEFEYNDNIWLNLQINKTGVWGFGSNMNDVYWKTKGVIVLWSSWLYI